MALAGDSFSLDARPLVKALDDLAVSFEKFGELQLELCDRLHRLIDTGAENLMFHLDISPASAACEIAVTAQPGYGLLVLMAAARTADGQIGIIEETLRHLEIFSSRLQPSKVDRVGEGGESVLSGEYLVARDAELAAEMVARNSEMAPTAGGDTAVGAEADAGVALPASACLAPRVRLSAGPRTGSAKGRGADPSPRVRLKAGPRTGCASLEDVDGPIKSGHDGEGKAA